MAQIATKIETLSTEEIRTRGRREWERLKRDNPGTFDSLSQIATKLNPQQFTQFINNEYPSLSEHSSALYATRHDPEIQELFSINQIPIRENPEQKQEDMLSQLSKRPRGIHVRNAHIPEKEKIEIPVPIEHHLEKDEDYQIIKRELQIKQNTPLNNEGEKNLIEKAKNEFKRKFALKYAAYEKKERETIYEKPEEDPHYLSYLKASQETAAQRLKTYDEQGKSREVNPDDVFDEERKRYKKAFALENPSKLEDYKANDPELQEIYDELAKKKVVATQEQEQEEQQQGSLPQLPSFGQQVTPTIEPEELSPVEIPSTEIGTEALVPTEFTAATEASEATAGLEAVSTGLEGGEAAVGAVANIATPLAEEGITAAVPGIVGGVGGTEAIGGAAIGEGLATGTTLSVGSWFILLFLIGLMATVFILGVIGSAYNPNLQLNNNPPTSNGTNLPNTSDFATLMAGQGRLTNILGDENSFVQKVTTNGGTTMGNKTNTVDPSYCANTQACLHKIYQVAVAGNVNPVIVLTIWGVEKSFTFDQGADFGCITYGGSFQTQLDCVVNSAINPNMNEFGILSKQNGGGPVVLKSANPGQTCIYTDAFVYAFEMMTPVCHANDGNDNARTNFVKFYKMFLGQ